MLPEVRCVRPSIDLPPSHHNTGSNWRSKRDRFRAGRREGRDEFESSAEPDPPAQLDIVSDVGTRCGNRSAARCVLPGMDEDERDRIAELHFDNDPQVITELRRDPQIAAYLNRLDDVVARLRALGRM